VVQESVSGNDVAAIRDLVASATIFAGTVNDILEACLRAVAGDRLTTSQLKLLTLVARTSQLGVSDAATFLGISTAAASKAVDRLAKAGLLERREVPGDRRALALALTSEGSRLFDEYERAAEEALAAAFADDLPVDPHHIAVSLDRLSLMVATGDGEAAEDLCFRCGIYFRDRCLLRGRPGGRTCYMHLAERSAV
jgi:DNA-binding MarR family transcriptional regulator